MKEQVKEAIQEALTSLGINGVEPEVTTPTDITHGDYTTNVAMVAFGKLKEYRDKNGEYSTPLELAEAITSKFTIQHSKFKNVRAVRPGFINFWLADEVILKKLSQEASSNPEKTLSSKKVMVEFTDPNPFKEFHIGHLYSNIVGESISRLLEHQGAQLMRVCYQGDVGLHVAKSIWGMQELMKEGQITLEDLGQKDLTERVAFMGKAYAHGATAYEDLTTAQDEIKELNKKIFAHDPSIQDIYQKGKAWSLEYFESIYTRLGTKFQKYYFESETGVVGEQIVREGLKKGIFGESEGAIIFRGEEYGFHSRVFINSLGLPTYEAKDLGLAITKYEDYAYDKSIIITGNEVNEYFKVMLKALSLIRPDLATKTEHLSHGMVRLPEGKMSSRTGNVLLGMWLLDEVKQLICTKYPDMEEESLEQVAQGAVKYALLKNSIGGDISFDLEQSVSFEGNSGPYLQYTYVRTQSILAKAKINLRFIHSASSGQEIQDARMEKEEEKLLRTLYKFQEIVEEAATKYAPHILATYLFELSQLFSTFYEKHSVIGAETEQKKHFRLALVASVGSSIKAGLDLLGIKAPEKM